MRWTWLYIRARHGFQFKMIDGKNSSRQKLDQRMNILALLSFFVQMTHVYNQQGGQTAMLARSNNQQGMDFWCKSLFYAPVTFGHPKSKSCPSIWTTYPTGHKMQICVDFTQIPQLAQLQNPHSTYLWYKPTRYQGCHDMLTTHTLSKLHRAHSSALSGSVFENTANWAECQKLDQCRARLRTQTSLIGKVQRLFWNTKVQQGRCLGGT